MIETTLPLPRPVRKAERPDRRSAEAEFGKHLAAHLATLPPDKRGPAGVTLKRRVEVSEVHMPIHMALEAAAKSGRPLSIAKREIGPVETKYLQSLGVRK